MGICDAGDVLLSDEEPVNGDEPAIWTVVDTKDLYRDDWVVALRQDVLQRTGANSNADRVSRRVLEHPGSVVVLAIDDEDQVVCVRQYRHSLQRRFVELPAGVCDSPGEDPLCVAQRELMEEAALIARHWTLLSITCSSLGLSTETVTIYLAQGLESATSAGFMRRHEEADMEVFRAPFHDLLDAVIAGRLANAQLVIAVLTHQLHRSRREQTNSNG